MIKQSFFPRHYPTNVVMSVKCFNGLGCFSCQALPCFRIWGCQDAFLDCKVFGLSCHSLRASKLQHHFPTTPCLPKDCQNNYFFTSALCGLESLFKIFNDLTFFILASSSSDEISSFDDFGVPLTASNFFAKTA